MSNQYIIDYVEYVISKSKIPDEYKMQLENELFRSIIAASENTAIENENNLLCSPEMLANEIGKMMDRRMDVGEQNRREPAQIQNGYHHQRYCGEYMREQSNVNLKLLYIPLVQISSGTERISMPLTDDC